jgi:hypothetical protein
LMLIHASAAAVPPTATTAFNLVDMPPF